MILNGNNAQVAALVLEQNSNAAAANIKSTTVSTDLTIVYVSIADV